MGATEDGNTESRAVGGSQETPQRQPEPQADGPEIVDRDPQVHHGALIPYPASASPTLPLEHKYSELTSKPDSSNPDGMRCFRDYQAIVR